MKGKSSPLLLPLSRKNIILQAHLHRKLLSLFSICILCHFSYSQKVSITSGNLTTPSTWTDLTNGKGTITIHYGESTGTFTDIGIATDDVIFDHDGNFAGIVSGVSASNFTLYYPSLKEISSGNFLKQGTAPSTTSPDEQTVLVIRADHEISIDAPFTTKSTIIRQGIIKVSTTPNLTFGDHATYLHYTPFADYHHIPIAASWAPTSNCFIYGADETSLTPSYASMAQTFGNFIWNCPNQGSNNIEVYFQSEALIQGELSVISTGNNGSIVFTNTIARTLPINGNFTLTGGTITMSKGNKSQIIRLNGDFIQTGGTITTISSFGTFVFNGNSTQKFRKTGGTISNKVNFEISAGSTIDFDESSYIEGNGTFTLNDNANFSTANTQGINGSVRNTGTKIFSTNGNYIYTGTKAQVTGTYLPISVNQLTINNSANVSLSQSVTVNGTFDNQQGEFILNGKNFGLAGLLARGGPGTGTITGNTSSSIAITGTGDAGTLYFTSGSAILKNISLNRTSGKIALNKNLQITGQATFTEGILKPGNGSRLIFTSTGSCSGASDLSYVEGIVEKQSSTTLFVFPVGKNNLYRPLTTSAFTGNYAVEYFNNPYAITETVTTNPPIHLSPFEYWHIENSGSENSNMTFYWQYDQMPATSVANLRLAYFDETISKWNTYPVTSTIISAGASISSGSITLSSTNNKKYIALASEEGAQLHCPLATVFYEAGTPYGPGISYEWTLSKEIADLSFSNNNQRATLFFHGNLESEADLQLIVKENNRIVSKKIYPLLTFPQNFTLSWPKMYCANANLILNGPQDPKTNSDYEKYEWQKNGILLSEVSQQITDKNTTSCTYQLRVFKTTSAGSCWSKPFSQEIKFAEIVSGGIYRRANR